MWLELTKDYDLNIQYHPGKANVVAIALSRTGVPKTCMQLTNDLDHMGISLCYAGVSREETELVIRSPLREQVRVAQLRDRLLLVVRKCIEAGRSRDFSMEEDGTIYFRGCLCVPQKAIVKMEILREAHQTPYTVHPGETKMYQDLKQSFWWKRMKVDIAKYVASCGICQKVKAEHQRPAGLLKPLEIPTWKFENITTNLWLDYLVPLEVMMQFGL
jgi:hypothetical protein